MCSANHLAAIAGCARRTGCSAEHRYLIACWPDHSRIWRRFALGSMRNVRVGENAIEPRPPSSPFRTPKSPLPGFGEISASLDSASQARCPIGGALGRPPLAYELLDHQSVLWPHLANVPLRRRQPRSYLLAPGASSYLDQSGLRVWFVFGCMRYDVTRYLEKLGNPLAVRQQPGFDGSYRNSEAQAGNGFGQVSMSPRWCAFVPIEITEREPCRVTGSMVEALQASLECGKTRVMKGAGFDGGLREEPPHNCFIYRPFDETADRGPAHQKSRANCRVSFAAARGMIASPGE